jgi:predicted nuclease of restriction endonuclease-like (RecB) superfamily
MKITAYRRTLEDVSRLLAAARATSARSVNQVITTTYFLIGRRIVEEEQNGKNRAGYGEQLIEQLSVDLAKRFGRGFGRSNLMSMRAFFLEYRDIIQMPSGQSFPLPWSHYVRLLSVKSEGARRFYEREAFKGGWTFKQLDRQVQSQFYERSMLSTKKLSAAPSSDPATEIRRDPFLLEFLDLKDEYSESDFEAALVARLESFLLELGSDFAFIGRQKRLRIGEEWYRVDLLLFHRRLRCLVIVDLKLGKFTHADAGQMHVYLNYARRHWTLEHENPPVGLILCAEGDQALAHYALEGLSNTVLAAEYRTVLPQERTLIAGLQKALVEAETNVLLTPTPIPITARNEPVGAGPAARQAS